MVTCSNYVFLHILKWVNFKLGWLNVVFFFFTIQALIRVQLYTIFFFNFYICILLGAVFAHSHVSFTGSVTLLDPDLFWGIQSKTWHWAA